MLKDPNGYDFLLVNKQAKGIHPANEPFSIKMSGNFEGSEPPTAIGIFMDVSHNHQTLPPLHVSSAGSL